MRPSSNPPWCIFHPLNQQPFDCREWRKTKDNRRWTEHYRFFPHSSIPTAKILQNQKKEEKGTTDDVESPDSEDVATAVNRTRTCRLEGGNPNHWTTEACNRFLMSENILTRLINLFDISLPRYKNAKCANSWKELWSSDLRRDRTCNLLIRSQAPCHWASRPVELIRSDWY